MSQDWLGAYRNTPRPDVRDAIQQLGLNYRLMTQYTSFVAVEETTIVEGGKPRIVDVPVEMPEGVSYEGIYGRGDAQPVPAAMAKRAFAPMRVGGFVSASPVANETAALPMRESRPTGPASKIAPRLAAQKTGLVSVQIWLTDTTPRMLAKLKALGVDVLAEPKSRRIVIARVAAEKLQALAALSEVTYIAPLS